MAGSVTLNNSRCTDLPAANVSMSLDVFLMLMQAIASPLRSCGGQDGNWGLVQLASEGRTKRRIQRLTQTYLTLSLQDIAATARLASPQEAELHILRWVLSSARQCNSSAGARLLRTRQACGSYR